MLGHRKEQSNTNGDTKKKREQATPPLPIYPRVCMYVLQFTVQKWRGTNVIFAFGVTQSRLKVTSRRILCLLSGGFFWEESERYFRILFKKGGFEVSLTFSVVKISSLIQRIVALDNVSRLVVTYGMWRTTDTCMCPLNLDFLKGKSTSK